MMRELAERVGERWVVLVSYQGPRAALVEVVGWCPCRAYRQMLGVIIRN